MTNLEQLKEMVDEIRGTEKGNDLLSYMLEGGYDLSEWMDLDTSSENVLKSLSEYFGLETAVDVAEIVESGALEENADKNKEMTLEEIKKTKDRSKGKGTSEKEDKIAKGTMLKKYKTIDNLITLTENKETTLDSVDEINEKMYATYLSGNKIAKLWLNGNLTFDSTMQRGTKEDKSGNERAVFRENHVKDIYTSITEDGFTPTQIHLAIITDDEDLDYSYDSEDKELFVSGKIRLLDGQHRTRALVKVFNEIEVGKLTNIDLDKYVFNVLIHVVTSEEARRIYANIDKNLKLDKSQARQLQSDAYAKIVNFLNQSGESDLRGKISITRPVGRRLVLFNTIAQAIEDNIAINSVIERENVKQYIKDFFNYVAYKLPKAFGNDEIARMNFKNDNLLNENNFFNAWISIAFVDQDNYKQNIDKIVENIDYFKKDNPVWLKYSAVKHRVKGEGFAMNNTNTGINAMVKETLRVLGYAEKEGEGEGVEGEQGIL